MDEADRSHGEDETHKESRVEDDQTPSGERRVVCGCETGDGREWSVDGERTRVFEKHGC